MHTNRTLFCRIKTLFLQNQGTFFLFSTKGNGDSPSLHRRVVPETVSTVVIGNREKQACAIKLLFDEESQQTFVTERIHRQVTIQSITQNRNKIQRVSHQ